MKETNKLRIGLAMILCIFAALVWSCKDEAVDLTASRSQFVLDSIALVDSLARAAEAIDRENFISDRTYDSLVAANQAGSVTYAINVVDGSASSFSNGRTESTQTLVTGASVTVSQFGRTQTQTTTATGMAVFSGFFRNGLNVTITKAGFTSANYIVGVKNDNATPNGQKGFVGNIIPLFPTSGANTATISGKMTIQTDLTNKTRELVPDGTTVLVGIDATGTGSTGFRTKFLADGLANNLATVLVTDGATKNMENYFYVGEIKQANYETGVVGSTTAGLYTVTVPAAFDGLPLSMTISDIAADQKLFTSAAANGVTGDRTITQRTLFGPNYATGTALPTANGISIAFDAGSGATATAIISNIDGALKSIFITAGGSGFVVAPEVVIAAPATINGVRATATATITNGAITGITLVTAGSGYTTAPGVTFVNGGGATAVFGGLIANGSVTGVTIGNTGASYVTAPTVTFSGPGGTGTTATGTAAIDAQGRVTSVTITSGGSQYATQPTVTFSAAPAGGATALGGTLWTGLSVGNVDLTAAGANYLSAPIVTISKPVIGAGTPTGTQATAIAIYDAGTRTVSGIQITNSGSGYNFGAGIFPTITITPAGSGATASTLLDGGSVISVSITAQGTTPYVAAPIVTFTGGDGTGATGTAVISDGKVIAINVTSGGTGYTSAPTITITAGDGAAAYATVVNGVITAITVSDGGRNWVGAPRVALTSAEGGGGTATATVAGGLITGVTVSAGGTGYVEGNVPGVKEDFPSITAPTTKPGIRLIKDIHFGTGQPQPN